MQKVPVSDYVRSAADRIEAQLESEPEYVDYMGQQIPVKVARELVQRLRQYAKKED